MTDTPFAPFTPHSPSIVPETPAPGKRKKKASAAPETTTPAVEKPARKKRTAAAKPNKRQPKFELQTILKATAGMKEPDMDVFQKMLDQLQPLGKPARQRVLAGLGKVFA